MELKVEDTGIGISLEQQELIFDAFIQSEGQSTRKYGGTGLGLAITKRLVKMLGGQVNLESYLGSGSTFTFVFDGVAIAAPTWKPPSPPQSEDLEQFKRATFVAADDVRSNLDLIREYFAGSKHRLLLARDGQEAIQVACTQSPDIILLDLRMPILDGRETARYLRHHETTRHIPIIVLTASNTKEEEEELNNLWDGFLRKPFSRKQLVAELKKILPPEQKKQPQEQTARPAGSAQAPYPSVRAKWPELLEKLRREEENNWHRLHATQIRRDLFAFVRRLQGWALEYECGPLLDYAGTLEKQLVEFDLDGLPETLAAFPEIIARMET